MSGIDYLKDFINVNYEKLHFDKIIATLNGMVADLPDEERRKKHDDATTYYLKRLHTLTEKKRKQLGANIFYDNFYHLVQNNNVGTVPTAKNYKVRMTAKEFAEFNPYLVNIAHKVNRESEKEYRNMLRSNGYNSEEISTMTRKYGGTRRRKKAKRGTRRRS